MPDTDRIVRVRAATILHTLEVPIVFGTWIMRHREFFLVRVDAESGLSGFTYALTRDGPLAAIVDRTIAPQYVGQDVADPEASFFKALWANNSVHAAGIGMRALSVVDCAAWDLAAKAKGQNITTYLGGERRRMPVAGIVGYPPSISPAATVAQIKVLWDQGWRRFKLPIGPSRDESIARLRAAREAYPDAWLGIDANFLHKTAADAIEFGKRLDGLDIGWFEDIVPPGDAQMVREIREGISTPVAMGDEQGGSYHPQALLKFDAVDFNRLDATTNGGITRLRGILRMVKEHGNGITTHMYPHIHSQVLGALGYSEAPIEWGVPGTGVHPMDDPLIQPVVRDGLMDPLPDLPGFGVLVDPAWIARQSVVTDPDGLLDDL
ncbi:MAG: mandelate racemase/muconate lactonizing enzyme family protein [Chloroflexi bacterium]|nr:mandelate racemase/muconate lactonizing enzyme family protein [Chloroflexota bacterium]